MEAFAVVTGCASLIDYITRISCSIVSILDTAFGARRELEYVTHQLAQLELILKAITDDFGFQDLSSEGERELLHILDKQCLKTLEGIHDLVDNHDSVYGSASWALYGKTRLQSLRQSLDHDIKHLGLLLQKTTG